jgi:hypothetical protein
MHSRSLNTMLTQQGQHHAEVCVRPTPTLSPQQYGSQSNAPRPHDQCLAAPNFSGGQYEAPSTPRILETRPAILPWTCQPASSTGLTIWGRASPPMDRKRNMDASHGPLVLRSEMTGHAGPMQLGWGLGFTRPARVHTLRCCSSLTDQTGKIRLPGWSAQRTRAGCG